MALTRYEVAGWGVGELWTAGEVVVVHEFDFETDVDLGGGQGEQASRQGRVSYRGTSPLFLDARPGPPATQAASRIGTHVIACVRAFLAGEEAAFEDVALELDWCTEFQRSVITVLRGVPRGEVVSYGELAALAGYPGAQRAAASVCARNRFAFVVPCHRVVAADGIGGYGSAGVAVKRRLLALEGVSL